MTNNVHGLLLHLLCLGQKLHHCSSWKVSTGKSSLENESVCMPLHFRTNETMCTRKRVVLKRLGKGSMGQEGGKMPKACFSCWFAKQIAVCDTIQGLPSSQLGKTSASNHTVAIIMWLIWKSVFYLSTVAQLKSNWQAAEVRFVKCRFCSVYLFRQDLFCQSLMGIFHTWDKYR